MPKYIFNILISLDQLVNVLLLGDPDETISSRLGKWKSYDSGLRKSIADNVCWALHLIDPNHCRQSIESDEGADAIARSIPD